MSNAAKLKKRAAEYEQKKQYDKALALYVQVLQAADGAEEDADVPLFNRVGDLLLRLGNVNEALTYFEKAIDLYAERGFLNNAIALCNRVLRQSPSRTGVYYKLGRISAAKGFKSDAKKNFLEYADRMQRAGELDEAFRALKEFADLCPDQDDIRLMLAEQLSKEGRKNEALEQLQLLHSRLESEGRNTEARATVDRMKAIAPDFVPSAASGSVKRSGSDLVFLDLGDNGSHAGTSPSTRQVSDPDMVAWQTSAEASAARASQGPAAAEPEDELRLILPEELGPPADIPPLELEPTSFDGAVAPTDVGDPDDSPALIDLEPTALDAGVTPIDLEPTLGADAMSIDLVSTFDSNLVPLDLEPSTHGADIPPIELEPTSLVAPETSPDDSLSIEGAFEPLDLEPTSLVEPDVAPGEGAALDDAHEPLEIETTSFADPAAAPAALPEIEFESFGEVAPDAIAPDPEAASDLEAAEPAPTDNAYSSGGAESLSIDDDLLDLGAPIAGSASGLEPSTSLDPDVSFPLDDYADSPGGFGESGLEVPPADTGAFPPFPSLSDDDAIEIEALETDEPALASEPAAEAFDGDVRADDATTGAEAQVESMGITESGSVDAHTDAATDSDVDISLDADDIPETDVSVDELAEAAAALVTPSASPRVDDDHVRQLEERVQASPGDWALRRTWAEALLERGDREAGLAELETAMTGLELEGHFDDASTLMEELLALTPSSVRLHQRRVEFAVRSGDRGQLVRAYVQLADALFRSGEPEKAGVVYQRVIELAPDNAEARDGLSAAGFLDDEAESAPAAEALPAPPPAIAETHWSTPVTTPAARNDPPAGDDFVDLGDLLRAEEAPRSTRMVTAEEAPSGDEQADFDEMLRRFKQGISDNVDEEDFESHYDLGVAYKEMGLVDEAIAEFQKSLRGPALRLRACEALGACFVEKEQYQVATSVLRRALALGDADDHQLVGVLFLLGQACEALGRTADALGFYQRVFAVDIEFRDVIDRITALDRIAT
jgi:tetratricopeptide (TPR) repeat protein